MPTYPPLDQYNDAVQHPDTAFSDATLKAGKVTTSGLGIPIALGGGFVITYTVTAGTKKYAVRCFHKDASGLEARYADISRTLSSLASPYFVGFEYQASGVLVNGHRFPIVKMDWASGETLGAFLEKQHSDKSRLAVLRKQFQDLERFLRDKGLAHGDIQNGNVMVGSEIRLIDYDGMFVPTLTKGRGNEIGHRHFQHPKRSASDFGPDMDRFSFIAMDLSLRALAESPALFAKFSNGENVIFSGGDYADPSKSQVFSELRGISGFQREVDNFAQVCAGPINSIPTLEDFLAGRNIPTVVVSIRSPGSLPSSAQLASYVGAYAVIDATIFDAVAALVGDRIELIGQITEVKLATTRYGKPYIFINFGSWRGSIAKITIWSEGLAKLANPPDETWVGKWISVTGLVDAPFTNKRYRYTHVGITLTESNQLREISVTEAKRRLASTATATTTASHPTSNSNSKILEAITNKGKKPSKGKTPKPPVVPTPSQAKSKNELILEGLGRSPSRQAPSPSPSPAQKTPVPDPGTPKWVWVVVVIVVIVAALALGGK